jgi:hypothetical protein
MCDRVASSIHQSSASADSGFVPDIPVIPIIETLPIRGV